ncbi:MAG: ATP-grasp domain-containing protein [Candidatus Auribacter fodinae]|jgi:D-alanine-D-alanine ligase|uniref:ATP-grasp domain-containing protein n=1 Tax=Candidatus Auribacter fodinae TaxID=2093366 RepID=A0A3A4R0Y9_9BACT|nr:MAG: ATP-grasp domain-containing protein [Candidatus Auribacter fodinae]
MNSPEKITIPVGLCYNLKSGHHNGDDDEEYDTIETIDFLDEQLSSFGLTVYRMEQDNTLFHNLLEKKPAFVFNIAEGRGKTRSRESQVPCLLDWLSIPHYGSDGIALGITLDKLLTNTMLAHNGIPVPKMYMADDMKACDALASHFDGRPFIVKPRWEGSSKGIFNDSVVDSFADCKDRARRILSSYHQPALIEEFITGDEVTVAVKGNEELSVIGMMRISEKSPSDRFVYSLENKREWQTNILYQRASDSIPPAVCSAMRDNAFAAFRCLDLHDVARIDFRIDSKGVPRIIDINPLPGLSPEYSDIMLISKLHDRDFTEVVREIIAISLRRNKIVV